MCVTVILQFNIKYYMYTNNLCDSFNINKFVMLYLLLMTYGTFCCIFWRPRTSIVAKSNFAKSEG